jgi:hypothetical protein
MSPATIGITVGVLALLALLLVGALLFGRRIVAAWRQRRRKGGSEEGVQPMEERTGAYRWYDDAHDVAADLEARGVATQRLDHNALLLNGPTAKEAAVPLMATGSAFGGLAPIANRSASRSLAEFNTPPTPPARAVQRVNPLLAGDTHDL